MTSRLVVIAVASSALILGGNAVSPWASSPSAPTAAASSGAAARPGGTAHNGSAPGARLQLLGSHVAGKPSAPPPSHSAVGAATTQLNVTELAASVAHLNLVLFGLPAIAANGAMGENIGGWHSVGGQRDVTNHFLQALATNNPSELTQAIGVLEYTFANQNADGSWPEVAIPGSPYPPGGAFMGTVFFYASLGRSLGLTADSQWFLTSPATAVQRARLAALAPKISRGLAWLDGPANSQRIQGMGRGAMVDTNRAAAGAEGFLLVGHWLNNGTGIATGEQLLNRVESSQLPDGTILESGGFDAGYQTVSLSHLYDLYFHLTGSLAALRPAVWNELVRGMAKENSVILPSGEINFKGSTRTGCGGETFHGQPKTGGGQDLSRVEAYTAAVTGNNADLSLATRVTNYYNTHSHSHC